MLAAERWLARGWQVLAAERWLARGWHVLAAERNGARVCTGQHRYRRPPRPPCRTSLLRAWVVLLL